MLFTVALVNSWCTFSERTRRFHQMSGMVRGTLPFCSRLRFDMMVEWVLMREAQVWLLCFVLSRFLIVEKSSSWIWLVPAQQLLLSHNQKLQAVQPEPVPIMKTHEDGGSWQTLVISWNADTLALAMQRSNMSALLLSCHVVGRLYTLCSCADQPSATWRESSMCPFYSNPANSLI